ncbi:MAG: 4-hydroxy-tetrahydrodipicolinate synthase [Paludibacteraceae bacterium]|nr:4-hydroxy-tetrahydrodipicolinate synthase [Paludibacteraceae bacterium]
MIKGLGTALITPFDANGKVDYDALARLLDTQLTGFVDYLVVLGTTGEAATLTAEEKKEVRQFIAEHVKLAAFKRHYPAMDDPDICAAIRPVPIPLVLGVGGNNTAAVCAELDAMRDELSENYAAILSVCPYYNKPNQEGLYQHFCKVAEASPIPVILYNVPGRTGVNLLPETVMRIYEAHPDKIIGIKEASGNIEQIKRLIGLSGEAGLLVISGDDGIACEVMQAGGAGLISVASNAFPEDFWHIVHDQDATLQARYAEMIRLLFAEGNPVGIKAVLAQKGLITNSLRLPLVPASQELQAKILRLLRVL